MGTGAPLHEERPRANQVPLHGRAVDDLAFIRQTMARSGAFTAVPGWGMVGMGVVAILGSWLASTPSSLDGWIYAWLGVALLGCSVGVVGSLIKAKRQRLPLWNSHGRRFVMSFLPAILAGCVITEMLYESMLLGQDLRTLMPAQWLLLYGVGVMSAGVFSIRLVPLMGLVFMLYGIVVFYVPVPLDQVLFGGYRVIDALLALGFGGLHILFGLLIALRHGG
jgi:MFS family permease